MGCSNEGSEIESKNKYLEMGNKFPDETVDFYSQNPDKSSAIIQEHSAKSQLLMQETSTKSSEKSSDFIIEASEKSSDFTIEASEKSSDFTIEASEKSSDFRIEASEKYSNFASEPLSDLDHESIFNDKSQGPLALKTVPNTPVNELEYIYKLKKLLSGELTLPEHVVRYSDFCVFLKFHIYICLNLRKRCVRNKLNLF